MTATLEFLKISKKAYPELLEWLSQQGTRKINIEELAEKIHELEGEK